MFLLLNSIAFIRFKGWKKLKAKTVSSDVNTKVKMKLGFKPHEEEDLYADYVTNPPQKREVEMSMEEERNHSLDRVH